MCKLKCLSSGHSSKKSVVAFLLQIAVAQGIVRVLDD
jgi:hypothetical protein